ncbi:hypothetical protein GUJ93_ZPchr0006g41447 [Zizania palustris]|uniref:Uncharacterized protein n=1 Tax=Zizania palustris TaxID=103762 RepID=A0A8J5T3V0_ZIZPA|nr:hypothetical protein GUJ93_ZPchr0006g41447 [Zizania palustris]
MASTAAAMVRAVVVAAVLLQCCGVLHASRPLEGSVGGGHGWLGRMQQQQAGGAGAGPMTILQVLNGPGTPNGCSHSSTTPSPGGKCVGSPGR